MRVSPSRPWVMADMKLAPRVMEHYILEVGAQAWHGWMLDA